MYANLNKSFLDKTRKEAIEEAIAEMGREDGDNSLYYPETKQDEIQCLEIEDTEIKIDIQNELGFFSVTIPLDTETLEKILSVVIKRMNKIKALLESLN